MADERSSLVSALFPRRWGHWLGPLLAAGALTALVAVIIVTSGRLNLAASTPHPEGWAQLLHYTFERSVAHHAQSIAIPAGFDSPAEVVKGATQYDRACSHCHGAPGLGQNPLALSMMPRPQYLPREVADFDPRELFWIVKHGVKYSAMPGWPAGTRDDEIWSMVAFLKNMPKLTAEQYLALAKGPDAPAAQARVNDPGFGSVRRGYAMGFAPPPPVDSYGYVRPAVGFGNAILGGDALPTCAQCHGVDGSGRVGAPFPNLTALDRSSIKTALADYASGKRASGFMQPVAVQLTDAQIDGLADYFTARRWRPAAAVAQPAPVPLGARLAQQGVAAKHIAACDSCHDITVASAKVYPTIDGQNYLYLRGQLRLYRSGGPHDFARDNPMPAIAHPLSDAEIDALASYYATRTPGAAMLAARTTG